MGADGGFAFVVVVPAMVIESVAARIARPIVLRISSKSRGFAATNAPSDSQSFRDDGVPTTTTARPSVHPWLRNAVAAARACSRESVTHRAASPGTRSSS